MIDNTVNAMFNPIYLLMAGGLAGMNPIVFVRTQGTAQAPTPLRAHPCARRNARWLRRCEAPPSPVSGSRHNSEQYTAQQSRNQDRFNHRFTPMNTEKDWGQLSRRRQSSCQLVVQTS